MFIRNLCLKDKQLNSTIVRSLNDSEKGFIMSGQIADTWMLHHRNAPCHTAISVKELLIKKGIPMVPHPPYSPDLSPCDFFLFSKLKFHLIGLHFGTVDNIQKVVMEQLRTLPHEDFQHCYREWEQRLWRCVASQGNCFEGDNVDL